MVRRLGPTTDNRSLAKQLNEEGYVTGTGRAFDTEAVSSVRRSYGIPPAGVLGPGEATVTDVAARLGIARSTIIEWIREGRLVARRDANGRFLVSFDSESEAACRRWIATSRQMNRDATGDRRPGPDDWTPAQVAEHLGISRDAVYNWIDRGYLPARHGPGGHAYVAFTDDVEAACRQRIAESHQLPAHVKAQALQAPTGGGL
jgi:excisionase family DNA binding protein